MHSINSKDKFAYFLRLIMALMSFRTMRILTLGNYTQNASIPLIVGAYYGDLAVDPRESLKLSETWSTQFPLRVIWGDSCFALIALHAQSPRETYSWCTACSCTQCQAASLLARDFVLMHSKFVRLIEFWKSPLLFGKYVLKAYTYTANHALIQWRKAKKVGAIICSLSS